MKKCISFLISSFIVLTFTGCFYKPHNKVDNITAFMHINVIPMTDEIVLNDYTVLVNGGNIVTVSPASEAVIPAEATIIDGEGTYLMPGLADMHVHSTDEWVEQDNWPISPLKLYLANGVTTIRNCGHTGDISLSLFWREEIDAGNLDGPAIFTTGSVFHGDHRGAIYEGSVQEQLDQGFDFIKLRDVRSADQFFMVTDEVRQTDAYMVSHVPFRVGMDQVLSTTVDEVAHIEEFYFETLDIETQGARVDKDWIVRIVSAMFRLYGTPPVSFDEAVVEKQVKEMHGDSLLMAAESVHSAGIMVGTTMVVNNPQPVFEPAVFLAQPESSYLSHTILDNVRTGKTKIQQALINIGPEYRYLAAVKYAADRLSLKTLREVGVKLLLGTDSGGYLPVVPGYSIHKELTILVENGFTPYEAICTATVNAGLAVKKMTGEESIGTIEEGKRADLIMLEENPLEDVGNIREPIGVMVGGKWYPEETLQQMMTIGE